MDLRRLIYAALLVLTVSADPLAFGQNNPAFNRTEDVIYGRKCGMALTLDVFKPQRKNGAAIFVMIRGGSFSDHNGIHPAFFQPYLDRGYTVFAVVHGSQPRFIIPEFNQDIHRAIRFVRHNAHQ